MSAMTTHEGTCLLTNGYSAFTRVSCVLTLCGSTVDLDCLLAMADRREEERLW